MARVPTGMGDIIAHAQQDGPEVTVTQVHSFVFAASRLQS
jgi:hypothetical protein